MPANPPERALLDAIRRHRLAKEALDKARAEHDKAREEVVTLLHEAGLVGFVL